MKRVRLEGPQKVDIKAIADVELNGDFGTHERLFKTPWGFVKILLYEEYYFRIESDLTVTVIYEEKQDKTEIEIISSGGKVGIGAISYGAEKAALTGLTKRLIKEGFTLVEGEYTGIAKDERKKAKEAKKEVKNENK